MRRKFQLRQPKNIAAVYTHAIRAQLYHLSRSDGGHITE